MDADFAKENFRDNCSPMYNLSDLPDLDDTTLKSQREVVKQANIGKVDRKTVNIFADVEDRKEQSDNEEDLHLSTELKIEETEKARLRKPAVVIVSGCTGSTAKRINGEYTERAPELNHDGRSTYFGAAVDKDNVCIWYYGEKRAWMISRSSQIGKLTAYAICKCTASTPWEISGDENWLVYTPGANFEGQKLKIRKKGDRPSSPNLRNTGISQDERIEHMKFAMSENRGSGMYDLSNLPDLE